MSDVLTVPAPAPTKGPAKKSLPCRAEKRSTGDALCFPHRCTYPLGHEGLHHCSCDFMWATFPIETVR